LAKKQQAKSGKKTTKRSTRAASAAGSRSASKKRTTKKKTTKKRTTKKTTKKKTTKKKTTKAKAAGAKKTAPKKTTTKKTKKTTKTASAPAAQTTADQTPAKIEAKAKPATTRPKPSRPEPAEPQRREPLSDAQLRKVKTGLTRKDLEHYRQLLLEKRADLLGDVEALQVDVRNTGGNMFNPEHMADVGSDNYEQEFTLGLMESERKLLAEIDEALMRIKNRTYGVCIESGTPINRDRLDVKPWAKYCIEVVRERERRGQY